jgi:hypothetical protein
MPSVMIGVLRFYLANVDGRRHQMFLLQGKGDPVENRIDLQPVSALPLGDADPSPP